MRGDPTISGIVKKKKVFKKNLQHFSFNALQSTLLVIWYTCPSVSTISEALPGGLFHHFSRRFSPDAFPYTSMHFSVKLLRYARQVHTPH